MRAEIVSVGTEILLGQITDTNAVELGKVFAATGIDHTYRQTVGDNLPRLTEALQLAISRSDIVVTIGGLGPTEDDLTRDGIAAALKDTLVHDPEIEAHLREVFRMRGFVWLDSQIRQAMRPSCSEPLANPNGTAPGLVCRKDGKTVFALPGPRAEFVPMLTTLVQPILAQLGGGSLIASRTLKIIGIGESVVEDRLRDLMSASDPTVAPYAKTGEVHLRLTTKAKDDRTAQEKLGPIEAEIRSRLNTAVYGTESDTLESAVVRLLSDRSQMLSTAESCTGGLLGQRLTSVAGASEVYLGGVVSYSNELKVKLLGVRQETLDQFGAVSEECAREMASGIVRATGSDLGTSVTGIAGPGGGTAEKPVGLVYIGVATKDDVKVHRFQFPGTRETVRMRSAQMALALVRDALLALSP